MRPIHLVAALLIALTGACACAQKTAEPPPTTTQRSPDEAPVEAGSDDAKPAEEAEATPPPKPAPPVTSGNPVAGRAIFAANCARCHTVGAGRLLAPDLRGVTQRRDRDWLIRFLRDPARVGHNDPTGKRLVAAEGGEVMPPPNLDDQQIRDLLQFLASPGETTVTRADRGVCHTGLGCRGI